MKAIEWRIQAERDAAEAAFWYARQGGLPLGERFLAQVDATLARIAGFPGIGSTRHAHVVADLPAPLHFIPVSGFDRHLVYCIDLPSHVEVVRLWHTARGLDALIDGAQ